MASNTKLPASPKPSLLGLALMELTPEQRQQATKIAASILLKSALSQPRPASSNIHFNEKRGHVPGGPIPPPTGMRKPGDPDPI